MSVIVLNAKYYNIRQCRLIKTDTTEWKQHRQNNGETQKPIRQKYVRKQSKNGVTKKCSVYQNKKKRNGHQHNTDDGGKAMGEQMRHVQISRWGKHIGKESKQQ